MELQELKVCIYDSGLGNRVGSIVGDKVYDLHLCCVQQLTSDKKSVDCYRLANNLVPHDLGGVLNGGSNVVQAARLALEWVLQKDHSEGPSGEPLFYASQEVRLRAPILPGPRLSA